MKFTLLKTGSDLDSVFIPRDSFYYTEFCKISSNSREWHCIKYLITNNDVILTFTRPTKMMQWKFAEFLVNKEFLEIVY